MPFPSQIGKFLHDLPTPCLVVSKSAYENNCKEMLEKAEKMGVQLRGQTKTHKTIEGGILQTGGSKRCIVVSTLTEAEMYANNGFDDILYGYPLLEQHMSRNFELTRNLQQYHVMVNSLQSVQTLLKYEPPKDKKWSIYLKIDVGYHRAGVPCSDEDQILSIAQALLKSSDKIIFQGLYAHCGNSYKGTNDEEVQDAREKSILKLNQVAVLLRNQGLQVNHQGIGSTPSCSQNVSDNASYDTLTEIHPGNYVFYDQMQKILRSCKDEDIAARVLTRVIGHFPGARNQIIIDGGFLALSEQGFEELGGTFAVIKGHTELRVLKMTQEIGFIEPFDRNQQIEFEKLPIGSVLELVQYHACDTAARYPVYYVHDEENRVVEEWQPTRCW